MADVDLAPSFGAELKVGRPRRAFRQCIRSGAELKLVLGWLQGSQCMGTPPVQLRHRCLSLEAS